MSEEAWTSGRSIRLLGSLLGDLTGLSRSVAKCVCALWQLPLCTGLQDRMCTDSFLRGEWQLAVWVTAVTLLLPAWSKAQLRAAWSDSSFVLRTGILPAHGRTAAARRPGALSVTFCVAVMAYMQFVEDYSEPQPSMFYQTPQNEHIYQQKNKHLMEVYGFNDSFISLDPSQDLAPPPALPPKQRQLVSDTAVPFPAPPGAAVCLLLLFLTGCGCGRGSHWCSRCVPCHLVNVFLGILHHLLGALLFLPNPVFRLFP